MIEIDGMRGPEETRENGFKKKRGDEEEEIRSGPRRRGEERKGGD